MKTDRELLEPVAWRVEIVADTNIEGMRASFKRRVFTDQRNALACAKQWPEQMPTLKPDWRVEIRELFIHPDPEAATLRARISELEAQLRAKGTP